MKDEVEKLLWNAISGAVAASINVGGDTTKISEEIFEVSLSKLLALIDKANEIGYESGMDDGAALISKAQVEAVRAARIDELKTLMAKHSRTYRQTITAPNGDVYGDDSHVYISKYETQERIAELTKEDGETK